MFAVVDETNELQRVSRLTRHIVAAIARRSYVKDRMYRFALEVAPFLVTKGCIEAPRGALRVSTVVS